MGTEISKYLVSVFESWDAIIGEGTEIDIAVCPLLIGNSMLLFGGSKKPRQISELYSWEKTITRRIRSLPFDFENGKCIYNNATVYLCFDFHQKKLCRYRFISLFYKLFRKTVFIVLIW